MRWAIFQDFRGVIYCEPVDEGLRVWVKHVEGRPEKKNWLGKVIERARPAERKVKVVFDPEVYDKRQYHFTAFEPAPEGYKYDPNVVYLKENRWGTVDVLYSTEDDTLGQRLQYALRKFAPDDSMWINERDNKLKPRPGNDRILEIVRNLIGA